MDAHSDGWCHPTILASSALFCKNSIFAVFRRKPLFFSYCLDALHLLVLIVGYFGSEVLCNCTLFDSVQWKLNEEIEGGEYFLINYNIIIVIIVVTHYSRISHLTMEILLHTKLQVEGCFLWAHSTHWALDTLQFWLYGVLSRANNMNKMETYVLFSSLRPPDCIIKCVVWNINTIGAIIFSLNMWLESEVKATHVADP